MLHDTLVASDYGDATSLGDRFVVWNDRIAMRMGSSVGVYRLPSMEPLGGPVASSSNGKTVNLHGDLLVVSEESENALAGQVRLLKRNDDGGNWTDVLTLPAPAPAGRFGWVTSLSDDGLRLAVSAPNARIGNDIKRGMVVVYQKDPTDGSWSLLGQPLFGNKAGDQFGFSMALSGDGTTLVVGSPAASGGDGNVFRGEVRVARLDGNNVWTQVGDTLPGENDRDRFGRSVAISKDGGRVVASSSVYGGQRGQVRVFDLMQDDEATSIGEHYEETYVMVGEGPKYRLGHGIFGLSLTSDGGRVAVGATWAGGEGSYSGRVDQFVLPSSAADGEQSSEVPSVSPSIIPSVSSSVAPSPVPTMFETDNLVLSTDIPTTMPSLSPTTSSPTASPSLRGRPLQSPSHVPSSAPSNSPIMMRSSMHPSLMPTSSSPSSLSTPPFGANGAEGTGVSSGAGSNMLKTPLEAIVPFVVTGLLSIALLVGAV